MSVSKARDHYIGESGCKRLNCAQTIAHAFKDKFNITDETIEQLAACGGGRAPEGRCGALHAAKVMLEKEHPERVKDCENALHLIAGSTKCREIRASRKLSCVNCVERIAALIEEI